MHTLAVKNAENTRNEDREHLHEEDGVLVRFYGGKQCTNDDGFTYQTQ